MTSRWKARSAWLPALFIVRMATPFTFEFRNAGEQATYYTLTSSATAGADPSSWTLRGSYDGVIWSTIDNRSDETFAWRLQTRPFKIANPGRYKHYALQTSAGVTLAEVELLGTASLVLGLPVTAVELVLTLWVVARLHRHRCPEPEEATVDGEGASDPVDRREGEAPAA